MLSEKLKEILSTSFSRCGEYCDLNASPVPCIICPIVSAVMHFILCFPAEGSLSPLEIKVQKKTMPGKL